jgi:alpha-tubulin suppressor-like RCC1 family protein
MIDAIRFTLPIGILAFSLCACGSSSSSKASGSPGNAGEATGEVNLAISAVPAGVQCIQITATGSSTVSQTFPAPDAGPFGTLSLGELPLGSVAITGAAFNVACANIGSQQPSWIADKQVVTLQAGVVTSLTLTFRPDNVVSGSPTFVGDIVQIAVGESQIDLLMNDGTVEAAGNLSGLYFSNTFNAVGPLSNVAQIAPSTGDNFDCAVLKNGTVECWGVNNDGQLGNGTTANATTPVVIPSFSNVTQVAAGSDHACALQANNTVWCWGNNSSGQIGNNATVNVTTPVQVMGIGATNGTIPSTVYAGGAHSCALADGFVWCWGSNVFGQIGNNTTTDAHTPVEVTSIGAITQLALGSNYTCALRADGAVFCWGQNSFGNLGTGNFAGALVPTQLSIANVVQIGTDLVTTCARKGDGTVWCWGGNFVGQVGDGTENTQPSPVQVMGLPPSANLQVGSSNGCSQGVDLSLACWGYNAFGQLGQGNNLNAGYVPVPAKL